MMPVVTLGMTPGAISALKAGNCARSERRSSCRSAAVRSGRAVFNASSVWSIAMPCCMTVV